MFKFFKKPVSVKNNIVEPIIPKSNNNYPNEVIEIHNEFNIAAEQLLQEAKVIIDNASTKNATKVRRLESLGFKQASDVSELKPLLQKAEISKEQIEFVNYYRIHYPLNKFITENQVKAICHKWNLVCGPVGRFKGFVPDKNLKEIEGFKLKNQDQLGDIVVFIEKTGKIEQFDMSKVYEGRENDVNYLINNYLIHSSWTYIDSYAKYPEYTKLIKKKKHIDSRFSEQLNIQTSLQICAPVKDMDVSGLELKEGYKLEKKHVPDPVVLQPVKGGYLILTAWGDEANDENVVNQTMN
jgi:hypothetical protein